MYIGKAHNRASFVGEIYEVIIFETALTDAKIEAIHNLLSNKWAVETSLPSEGELNQATSDEGIGSESRPFKFIRRALDRIRAGGKIKVRQGEYPDPVTITENVTIESVDGPIKLGTPKNDE